MEGSSFFKNNFFPASLAVSDHVTTQYYIIFCAE